MNDYNTRDIVIGFLRDLHYFKIADQLQYDYDERFFKTCVNLILFRTKQDKDKRHVRMILEASGAIV